MLKNRFLGVLISIIYILFFFFGCAALKKESPDFYISQGKLKLKEKDYLSAISYLQKVEAKDPEKKLTPESLLLTGEAFFQHSIVYRQGICLFSKETKEVYLNYLKTSRENFERVIKEYPKSDLADDAQFNIGLIFDWDELGGVNDFELALIEYQKVIDNYPGSSAYPKAKSRIDLIKSFYGELKNSPHDIKK